MNTWFLASGIAGVAAIVLAVMVVLRWRSRFDDPEVEQRVRRLLWGVEAASALTFALLFIGVFMRPAAPSTSNPPNTPVSVPVQSLPAFSVGNLVRSTYPRRSTGAIARNANLILWFKKPIDESTLLNGQRVRADAFTLKEKETQTSVQFSAAFSADRTIVVLHPDGLLGRPTASTVYEASLGQGLKTHDGEPVANPPLVWEVTVDRTEDHTAPTTTARFPDQATVDKNAVAQFTFSHAMNPLSVFSANGVALLAEGKAVPATVKVSDDFRTIEVFGNTACGVNTCGRSMFCFADHTSYTLTIGSVGDVNGNTLAAGPTLSWKTSDRLNRTAPAVVRVLPKPDASGVLLDSPVLATFSGPMLSTTISSSAVALPTEWLELSMLEMGATSQLSVFHPLFSKTTVPIESILSSDLMSIYQQCFAPCLGP